MLIIFTYIVIVIYLSLVSRVYSFLFRWAIHNSNFVPFSLQVNLSIIYRQNGYKNCLQAFLRLEYHVTFKTEKFSRKFCWINFYAQTTRDDVIKKEKKINRTVSVRVLAKKKKEKREKEGNALQLKRQRRWETVDTSTVPFQNTLYNTLHQRRLHKG